MTCYAISGFKKEARKEMKFYFCGIEMSLIVKPWFKSPTTASGQKIPQAAWHANTVTLMTTHTDSEHVEICINCKCTVNMPLLEGPSAGKSTLAKKGTDEAHKTYGHMTDFIDKIHSDRRLM